MQMYFNERTSFSGNEKFRYAILGCETAKGLRDVCIMPDGTEHLFYNCKSVEKLPKGKATNELIRMVSECKKMVVEYINTESIPEQRFIYWKIRDVVDSWSNGK